VRHCAGRWPVRALLAGAVVLTAIGTGAQPSGVVARVTSVVVWTLDAAEFQRLTPAARMSLEQAGIRIDAQARTLQSPELALAGHWLEFRGSSKRRHPIDIDGYVRLAERPPDATRVNVFAQVADKEPVGVLDDIVLVPEGQTPPATVLKLSYEPPDHMNSGEPLQPITGPPDGPRLAALSPPEVLRALFQPLPACRKRTPCGPVGSAGANARGCCLDYNGFLGDGQPYVREGLCHGAAILNFINSTCFQWTFLKRGRPCLLERAILQVAGKTCYLNHRFRNCQNMDETDFDVTPPSASIRFGQEATFAVRNNTPGNSTCFAFLAKPQASAKLARATTTLRASAACGDYELDHFDSKRHHESSAVKFQAPKKPPKKKCSEQYRVAAFGGGLTRLFNVEVSRPSCGFKFKGVKHAWQCGTATGNATYSGRVCGDPLQAEWDVNWKSSNSVTGSNQGTVKQRFSETGETNQALTFYFIPGDAPQVRIVGKYIGAGGCGATLTATAEVDIDDTCPPP
jgi:hypothetical protein